MRLLQGSPWLRSSCPTCGADLSLRGVEANVPLAAHLYAAVMGVNNEIRAPGLE
jgi:hypothetical protein